MARFNRELNIQASQTQVVTVPAAWPISVTVAPEGGATARVEFSPSPVFWVGGKAQGGATWLMWEPGDVTGVTSVELPGSPHAIRITETAASGRVKVTVQAQVARGRRRARRRIAGVGGAPLGPQPPFLANLQHWWDLADQTQVFADGAGATGITDGVIAQRINDKGTVPEDLIDVGSTMTWHQSPGGGNILPAGRKLGAGTAFTSQALSGGTFGAANQLSVAMVMRARPTFGGLADFVKLNNGPSDMLIGGAFSNWYEDHRFNAFRTSNKPIVSDEWVFMRWTDGSVLGNYRLRVSGAVEVVQAQNLTSNPSNTPVELIRVPGEISEILVWDIQFAPLDLTAVETYLVSRYGSIFPLP